MELYRYTLVCLLAFSFGTMQAQGTFNIVQQHPSTLSYNGATSVFELNDGYLVFSFGWALDSTRGAIQATKYDLEGEIQWQREHTRERNIYPGLVDPIALSVDGEYVAAVDEYSGAEPIVTWLYWFDANGDTLRTRFFKSDSAFVDANHGTRQLLALADGGYLHCGWCAVPQNTGCITRLDSAGGMLWERTYPGTNYIQQATELPDGGFVLGGSRPPNVPQDMAAVIRTDSAGNVQWVRYHGLHAITSGKKAIVKDDGTILMAGGWKSDPDVQTYDSWPSVYKYAPDGTFLARKDYYYSYNAQASFILDKADSHYWLVGGMFQYFIDPDGVTTLYELDENLDSLWMRRYYYYTPDDAESFVYCARAASDGGLVMCGSTRQGVTDPLPYLNSNWLIKLDSYGCLVPGCQNVGIEEVALGLNEYLHIAPNPVAQGQPLRVSFEPPVGFTTKGPLRVVVLDAMGRQVHEQTMPPGVSTFHFQLSAFSSGLYYLHLTEGSRWLAGAKMLVE